MTGNGQGLITANCEVSDDGGKQRNLEFELQLDQTQLPEIIKQLNQITKLFPIAGNFKIKNEY